MGRPSKYTPELVAEICERLSNGEPLAAICREDHMPGYRTVYDWAEGNEDISASIARARDEGEEAIAFDVLKIIDEPPATVVTKFGEAIDSGDVSNRRLRAEYRLKLLAKWNPKKWGDRVDVTTAGEKMEQTIHITREVIRPKE